MDDQISRRKAFEYFVTLWECIGTIMDRDEWEDVCMTTANEIPSVQPEIIRCKDCKFSHMTYQGECKYCQYLINEFGVEDAVYFYGNDFCSHAERREE